MTDTRPSYLTSEQHARAEALRLARDVLAEMKTPFSRGAAEPTDMHSLAEYIINGQDPWKRYA
jgi:hypothetical protein